MLQFAADENFDWRILRGLQRRLGAVDIVTVQAAGFVGRQDEAILESAANEGRVLLSHDVSTIQLLAYDRIGSGLAMPGVILAAATLPIGAAIAALEVMIGAGAPLDFKDRVFNL